MSPFPRRVSAWSKRTQNHGVQVSYIHVVSFKIATVSLTPTLLNYSNRPPILIWSSFGTSTQSNLEQNWRFFLLEILFQTSTRPTARATTRWLHPLWPGLSAASLHASRQEEQVLANGPSGCCYRLSSDSLRWVERNHRLVLLHSRWSKTYFNHSERSL